MKWEKVAPTRDVSAGETFRLKVLGGWLVKTVHSYGANITVAMVFISDPKHEWNLEG